MDANGDLDARARLHERAEREQWARERQELKDKNRRLKEQLNRTVKLLKMTQAAMVEQQKVVDRYQQEVIALHESARATNTATASEGKRKTDALAANVDDEQSVKRPRTQPSASKARHSLPLAERPMNQRQASEQSPRRRRSLPEANVHGGVTKDFGNIDHSGSWTKRHVEVDQQRPVISAAETLRAGLLHHQVNLAPRSHQASAHTDRRQKTSDDLLDFFSEDDDQIAMQRDVPIKPRALDREHQRPRTQQKGRLQPSGSDADLPKKSREIPSARVPAAGKENRFAYVEVVRNREERAALPGHDCIECRKYYEALDGLVPESEMKALCSRHRARFEPYQTPDDFWRLSFPDSHSEPSD